MRKQLIAIVDDDPSVRAGTMELVEAMGFAAATFERAEDFIHSGRLGDTSCMIVDVQMPGMSGLELCERLIESGNGIPAILITAFPDERDHARAERAGVVAYLTKPFGDGELLACINAALERRNAGTSGS